MTQQDHSPQDHSPRDLAQQDHAPRDNTGRLDPKVLEILVCPLTKSTLHYDREKQELVSQQAKLAYPILDGIPIMLPDEARRID